MIDLIRLGRTETIWTRRRLVMARLRGASRVRPGGTPVVNTTGEDATRVVVPYARVSRRLVQHEGVHVPGARRRAP